VVFGLELIFWQLLSGSHDGIERDCKITWLALTLKSMGMKGDGSSVELRHGQSLKSQQKEDDTGLA